MNLLQQKQWLQSNLDPKYKQADLALLKSKMDNNRRRNRAAHGNHERILWNLIHNQIATPEEILEHRANWDKKHKQECTAATARIPSRGNESTAGADLQSVPKNEPKQKETFIEGAKKKVNQFLNKKQGTKNPKPQTGKPKNKNTQK